MCEMRRERARTEPLYLIKELSNTNENEKNDLNSYIFDIMGSRGTNYHVEITSDWKWTCECPDFEKRHKTCKHQYFVLEKVLSLNDIEENKWELLTNRKNQENKKIYEKHKDQRNYINEDCPICYDKMTKECKVLWCKQCGNSVHFICFQIWKKKNNTCVYCRSIMNS
jgi:hypothetical protein